MDIVPLKGSTLKSFTSNRRKSAVRRHTTDVTFDQLPGHRLVHPDRAFLSSDYQEDSLSQDCSPTFTSNLAVVSHTSLGSSWNSIGGGDDFDTSSEISDVSFLEGSQTDVFREFQRPQNSYLAPAHQYQLSYELALDNVLTPFAGSTSQSSLKFKRTKPLTLVAHVIKEMVNTERAYVNDLSGIINGYMTPMQSRIGQLLPIKESDLESLFGNITEIRSFNQSLLGALQECGHNAREVGQCFLDKAEGFKIYTQYCNNYPNSVKVLVSLSKEPEVSRLLKLCQQRLNHMLPLGAYLLKPVQRVLKYSLLLGNMAKHMKAEDEGFDVVHSALDKMTEVAEHIDATKRKYDAAVHVQEIQSLIRGWEGIDLAKYGDLMLEENFRHSSGKSSGALRTRTERYLFLFQRLLLITKKEEDGFQYKTHLEMKDIQLTERVEKDPNCFQIRQASTHKSYTFQARTLEVKERWVRTITLMLMESVPHLPDKAKRLILAGFPTELRQLLPSHSPLRHRHSSGPEEIVAGLKSDSSASKTKGAPTRRLAQERFRGKAIRGRQRSSTSPNIRVASPTHSLVQASLTGLLTATIQFPEQWEGSPMEEEEEDRESCPEGNSAPTIEATAGQRDSGFSESLTGMTDDELQKRGRSGDSPLTDAHHQAVKEPPNAQSAEQQASADSLKLKRHKPAHEYTEIDFTSRRRKPVYRRSSSRSPSATPEPLEQHEEHQLGPDPFPVLATTDSNGTDTEAMQTKVIVVVQGEQDLDETLKAHMYSEESPQRGSFKGASPQPEHYFNGEIPDSPPSSPVTITRIDSLESEKADTTLTADDGSRPSSEQFGFDVIKPPSPFAANVSEPQESSAETVSRVQADKGITEEEEDLFDELMSGADSTVPPTQIAQQRYQLSSKSDSLSRADAQVLKSLLDSAGEEDRMEDGSPFAEEPALMPPREFSVSPEPEDITPKASPFSIRRWKLKSRSGGSEDFQTTPKASPFVARRNVDSSKEASPNSSMEDVPVIIQPPSAFRKSESSSIGTVDSIGTPILPVPLEFAGEPNSPTTETTTTERLNMRRHSFSTQHQNMVVPWISSRSTDTSPIATPVAICDRKQKETRDKEKSSSLKRRKSFQEPQRRPISVVGLISTTRSDLSLEDLRSLEALQPPDVVDETGLLPTIPNKKSARQQQKESKGHEFWWSSQKGSPAERIKSPTRKDEPLSSKQRKKLPDDHSPRSLFRFQRHKKHPKSSRHSPSVSRGDEELFSPKTSSESYPEVFHQETEKEPITVVPPYEGNPEETLSFDEILVCFDQYASATGQTTKNRSHRADQPRSLSPEAQRRKKKKHRLRSRTIASIDAATVKAAKEAISHEPSPPPEPRSRKASKVQQLAREYSRMIKEHQRSRIFSRPPIVVEEPPDAGDSPEEPDWLQHLRERRKSKSQTSQEFELPTPQVQELGMLHTEMDHARGGSASPQLTHDRDSRERSKTEVGSKSFTLARLSIEESPVAQRTHLSSRSPMLSRMLLRRASTDTASTGSGATQEDSDVQRKRRFRGWVKSLVEKFSGTSKDK